MQPVKCSILPLFLLVASLLLGTARSFLTYDAAFDAVVFTTTEVNQSAVGDDKFKSTVYVSCASDLPVGVGQFRTAVQPAASIPIQAQMDLGSVGPLRLVEALTLDYKSCGNCSRILALADSTPPSLILLQLQDATTSSSRLCTNVEIVVLIQRIPLFDLLGSSQIVCMQFTLGDEVYFDAIVIPDDAAHNDEIHLISFTIYSIESNFNVTKAVKKVSLGGVVKVPAANGYYNGQMCASVNLPLLCNEVLPDTLTGRGGSSTTSSGEERVRAGASPADQDQGWIFSAVFVEGKGLGFLIVETPSLNVVGETYVGMEYESAWMSCASNILFEIPTYRVPILIDQQVVRNVSSYYTELSCVARSSAVFGTPDGTMYHVVYDGSTGNIRVHVSSIKLEGDLDRCTIDKGSGMLYYETNTGQLQAGFVPVSQVIEGYSFQLPFLSSNYDRALASTPNYAAFLALDRENENRSIEYRQLEAVGVVPCPLNPFHVYREPGCVTAGYCGLYCFTETTIAEGIVVFSVGFILTILFIVWHGGGPNRIRACCCCHDRKAKRG